MTAVAQIIEQFRTLNPHDKVEVARSINEVIFSAFINQTKSEIQHSKDVPPFSLFSKNPQDLKLRQFLSTIWEKEALIDTDFTELAKGIRAEFDDIKRKCKKEIGISLRKAIDKIRLKKCCIAIDKNDDTITGIAYEIGGFNVYSTFYRRFKEIYGYGPGKYCKDCKNGNRPAIIAKK
jgi:transcriptional regulator GlxA family with amidase domain